jgi:hypothetical protein
LDVAWYVLLVAWSTRVIVAPEMSAPLESFTIPRSEVVAFCANASVAKVRMQQSIDTHRDRFTAMSPKVWTCASYRARAGYPGRSFKGLFGPVNGMALSL